MRQTIRELQETLIVIAEIEKRQREHSQREHRRRVVLSKIGAPGCTAG